VKVELDENYDAVVGIKGSDSRNGALSIGVLILMIGGDVQRS